MKIALIPINVGVQSAEQMVGIARKAEEVGVESVWTFEHVIVPDDYASKYPYSPTGKMAAEPDTNFFDPLIALATVAAHTQKLRLGTGVNILPQTNPLLLAKQAASLDALSGGRFMLGVGIGWLREEFEAMGVPFERRGARFDDYVQAMKQVWSGETVSHKSDFLQWEGFKSYPVPAQKPHLPVIIGGMKGKAFQRIARYGEGWFAPSVDPGQLAPLIDELKKTCSELGRDFGSLEISSMWIPAGEDRMDKLKAFEDLGVDRLIVPVQAIAAGGIEEGLERLGDEVISTL